MEPPTPSGITKEPRGTVTTGQPIPPHRGATPPLDDERSEPLRGRLLEKHGFQADMEHFAIFGVCQKCAGKARAGGAGGRR